MFPLQEGEARKLIILWGLSQALKHLITSKESQILNMFWDVSFEKTAADSGINTFCLQWFIK